MKTSEREAAPAVLERPEARTTGRSPVAKYIIGHPAQEANSTEKTATCSGRDGRYPRCELREAGPEETP